jgi:hypothetical protein
MAGSVVVIGAIPDSLGWAMPAQFGTFVSMKARSMPPSRAGWARPAFTFAVVSKALTGPPGAKNFAADG